MDDALAVEVLKAGETASRRRQRARLMVRTELWEVSCRLISQPARYSMTMQGVSGEGHRRRARTDDLVETDDVGVAELLHDCELLPDFDLSGGEAVSEGERRGRGEGLAAEGAELLCAGVVPL